MSKVFAFVSDRPIIVYSDQIDFVEGPSLRSILDHVSMYHGQSDQEGAIVKGAIFKGSSDAVRVRNGSEPFNMEDLLTFYTYTRRNGEWKQKKNTKPSAFIAMYGSPNQFYDFEDNQLTEDEYLEKCPLIYDFSRFFLRMNQYDI